MPSVPPTWLHPLADEADAAFLYRVLAASEPKAERAQVYRQLADVEDRHVKMWQRLLAGDRKEGRGAAPEPACPDDGPAGSLAGTQLSAPTAAGGRGPGGQRLPGAPSGILR